MADGTHHIVLEALKLGVAVPALIAFTATAQADGAEARAAFSENCFSPFMTAVRAAEVLPPRHDFYDLDPFRASNPVSPATKAPATQGTDRRCEVAFDGAEVDAGIETVAEALAREGITRQVDVPAGFPLQPGTQFAGARQLNPRRIAVVQVGVRPGPNGPETFLNVERLEPVR